MKILNLKLENRNLLTAVWICYINVFCLRLIYIFLIFLIFFFINKTSVSFIVYPLVCISRVFLFVLMIEVSQILV